MNENFVRIQNLSNLAVKKVWSHWLFYIRNSDATSNSDAKDLLVLFIDQPKDDELPKRISHVTY